MSFLAAGLQTAPTCPGPQQGEPQNKRSHYYYYYYNY